MKILFITDLYPIKSDESNSPRTLHNFVLEWINQGHEVDVVKPNFVLNSIIRGKALYKTGFYEFEGVKIFNVNYFTPFLFDVEKKIDNYYKDFITRKSVALNLFQGRTGALPCDAEASSSRRDEDLCSCLTRGCNPLLPSNGEPDLIIAHMPSGIIFANKLSGKMGKVKSEKNKGKPLNPSTFKPFNQTSAHSSQLTAHSNDPPLICGVHCSDIEVLTKPIYKFYFKTQLEQTYYKAKKIACRSHVLQKKFNELYPGLAEKTFVASSGVKVKSEKEPQFTAHSSQLTILTCANLIKRKNIDKLIKAVSELDGFELTVVGDGKELKTLANLTLRPLWEKVAESRMRGEPKIKFLGKLPQEKVFEQMQNSHIFILPSVSETFGMVYLEAMANGCITVCTKNDGIDGIIKDEENGFLTRPTVEGIKETLLRIKNFDNPDKIIENSLETAKNYTPEVCAENYLDNIK